MKRVMLEIAYDGTNYCGWQVQINGITVEEVLNKTLSELCHEDIKVIGASRTDSGVHALGNVAVFDTESGIPGEKFSFALNQRLPEDIRIQESCQVADDFHPRYCDTIKTYEYKILNRRFDMPTERLYSTFVYYPLDIDKMKRAAVVLVGEHDFKSFCSNKRMKKSTVRRLYDIEIKADADEIRLYFHGEGFLYNMVRILTGTLLEVGAGMRRPDSMPEILAAGDRQAAGVTAPPQGLTLCSVYYEKEEIPGYRTGAE